MSVEANKEIVRKYIGLVESGEVDKAGQYLDDDIKWWFPGTATYSKEEMLAQHGMFPNFSSSRTMKFAWIIGEGDRIAFQTDAKVHLLNGKTVSNTFLTTVILKDGKIASATEIPQPPSPETLAALREYVPEFAPKAS